MKETIKKLKLSLANINGPHRYWAIIAITLGMSYLLAFITWRKLPNTFPLVLRSNLQGLRYLGGRYLVWLIPILGGLFIFINQIINLQFFPDNKRLNKLVLFANIGIAVLVLVISIQLWWFNI